LLLEEAANSLSSGEKLNILIDSLSPLNTFMTYFELKSHKIIFLLS